MALITSPVVGAVPRLETERLILRPPILADFDAFAACAADPAVNEFIGGPKSRPEAWRVFMTVAGSWSLHGFAMFSVIEKATGRWIGRLGPWRPEGWPGNEVGWGLTKEAEGRSYAYEGTVAAIDWAFQSLGWTEMIHCIDSGNHRSEALARRLGSRLLRRQALPPPIVKEINVWGQTRDEWQKAAQQRAASYLPR
jgi:RimJ/RimL family protein N-acetyltransferase